jgi:alpha-beta hydrolase superfamily lysophospholipase
LGFTPPEGAVVSITEGQPSPDVAGLFYFGLKSERDHVDGLFALPVSRNGLITKYDYSQVLTNRLVFDSWIFDPQGKILGGVAKRGLNNVLYLLSTDGPPGVESWTTTFTGNADDFPGFCGYGCPPGFLLANGYFEGNYSSAVLFDIRTHKFGNAVLAAKDANICSSTFSPDLSRIDAFSSWGQPGKQVILSEDYRKISDVITSIVRGDDWTVQAFARDYSGALVIQTSDSRPPKYWHIDLKHKKGFVYYDLGESLGTTKLHKVADLDIRARDGLELHCYQLGLKEASVSAPVILWIGGGPFEGIHREWMPIMQCLASQGAVVVAMNYRGAKGFGKTYYQAGFSQADNGMVNDVEDIIGYLGKQSDFSGRKVMIVGTSFGGYLAVKALDRKRARADSLVLINPLIDPETLFKAAVQHGVPEDELTYQKQKWFGSVSSEGRSIMVGATNLLMPNLIIQSKNDEKVSSEVVHEFANRVSSTGASVEYLQLDDVHDITQKESWGILTARILDFVDRVGRKN